MSWVRTTLLMLVLSGLIYAYTHRMIAPPSPKEIVSPEITDSLTHLKVLSLAADERIVRFQIINKSHYVGEMTFQRIGERTWKIVSPVLDDAQSLIVSGMVSLLKMMSRNRSLSFKSTQAKSLGFDAPRLKVCITTTQSDQPRCLSIGDNAAIGAGAYAKWNDEDTYFLVNQNFHDVFDKSLYTLRKKQIFSIPRGQVRYLRYRTRETEYEIKKENDQWVMTKPTLGIVDQEVVEGLITLLHTLHIKDFLDTHPQTATDTSLAPSRVIRLIGLSGQKQTLRQTERIEKGRDAYYVKAGDRDHQVLVSKSKLDQFDLGMRSRLGYSE